MHIRFGDFVKIVHGIKCRNALLATSHQNCREQKTPKRKEFPDFHKFI
jgi:hypothetical protein